MANYYEMIEMKPTATDKEIENAIDARYNQWRALVTHHDDKVRDQANQAMRMLEQIRATLSDPAKRAVYDEAIGVRGATAGLVDPNAVLNVPRVVMTPPPPPRPSASKPVAPEASASKLWACQKCGEKNPEHTPFCYNCGAQLVRECPKCNKNTSLVATGFCGSCGANFDETIKRIELRTQLASELNETQRQQDASMNESRTLSTQATEVSNRLYSGSLYAGVGTVMLIFAFLVFLYGLREIILLLFGVVFLLTGIGVFILWNSRRKQANAIRDAEANNFKEQADKKKSQAQALEVDIMRLREQLQELAD